MGAEDPVLLGRGQPGVERHDLQLPVVGQVETVGQRVGGVPDLPLTGEEHQHVSWSLGRQLLDRIDDRLGLVADDRLAVVVLLGQLR